MATIEEIKKEIEDERKYIREALTDLKLEWRDVNDNLKIVIHTIKRLIEKKKPTEEVPSPPGVTHKKETIEALNFIINDMTNRLNQIDNLFILFSEGRKLADVLQSLDLTLEKRLLTDYNEESQKTRKQLESLRNLFK